MRSSLAFPSLALSFAALCSAGSEAANGQLARRGGIIDAAETALEILAAAVSHSGEYYVQNVATGEYLHFERPGSTTNLVTGSTQTTITLGQDSATGYSGTNYGTYSGTYFTGLSKCMSAQYGSEDGAGIDIAGVSYACVVGSDATGTATLEVAKQFWALVKIEGSDDSSDVASVSAVVLAAAASSETSSSSSADAASSTITSSAAAASTTSSDTAWSPSTTESVNPYDQTTWVCRHPGWWLYRHQDYITSAGHVECKDDLAAYEATLRKRATHGGMARKLRKRAEDGIYAIIAVDHLSDMVTRSLGSSIVTTSGGYQSMGLVDYDSTDTNQQWKITAA
ncbi:hypothetical protein BCR35DRAFT_310789 [Leucosporidium creatinivorum]|uniref:Ricin B lectin domain-containing protein n=1 Tax=Leucosporidium creatinivorum TaxID=106004 RepID=A0A1Y2CRV3_9BASI|nr:hypothetical protein BCR35DRAFT_310789 [Leucosporidium creatinivorum]